MSEVAEAPAKLIEPLGDDAVTPLQGAALIFAIVVLAAANFMAILDISIVNVAIPYISGGLAVSPNEGTWVITSYAVAEAIVVPLTGWLSLRFGAVRVFVIAVVGFGVASILCGLSISLPMLLAFRILQGAMGAPLIPASQMLLLRVSPPAQQGMALGLWSMTTITAPVAGPWLGGVFADSIGWRWVFYVNVPVAIACALLAWTMLRSHETETVRRKVDYVGFALLAVWVAALQVMLDNGEKEDWFESSFIVAAALVALIGFAAFIIWEMTEEQPIVDLRVFRYRTFVVSAITVFLTFGSFAATLVIIPLWLQTNMNYPAHAAGEIVALTGVFGVIVAPIAAALMTRVDPRALISAGLLIVSGAAFYRIGFDRDMTATQLGLAQLAFGLGFPLFFVPIMSMSMSGVRPEETASAAGLINFVRTMSTAVAVAVATSFWSNDAARSRVDLVAVLNQPDTALRQFQHAGLTTAQALQTLDATVQTQAVMLSTTLVLRNRRHGLSHGARGVVDAQAKSAVASLNRRPLSRSQN